MPILALIGSGEFTDSMIETDQFLLTQIKDPVVAIIPTAAGLEDDYEKWINDGIKHFEKLNAKVFGAHLLNNKDANDPKILNQLSDANFFYLSGGDPGHLLDSLKDSKAWEVILEKHKNGAVLAGSSAGAMVLGKKVIARIYNFFRTGHLPDWEEGIGLVDFAVIPHFDKISEDLTPQQIKELHEKITDGVKIVGIDEDTAYIRINNEWKIMGKGRVYNPAFK